MNIVILIGLCVIGTYGMADQCISGPDIVPVCSNVTMSTNQMFIPVNGSIGTGCICDVQLVEAAGDTLYGVAFRGVDINNLTCGYLVLVSQDTTFLIISCSKERSLKSSWRLNELYRLAFIRDSTPNPTGFCLQVETRDARFNMKCRKINTSKTTTESGPVSSQQTTRSAADTSTWNSTTTDEPIHEVTDNLIVEKLPVAAIGGGIGGAVLLLIVIIVIVILCKRRHQNNYDKPSDRITESTNYNNLRVKDEMVITDNDLYVSYDDDKNQSTTPTSDLQPVQGHTFANTNGPQSPDTSHSTPDLQPVQGHTNANIDDQQPSHTNHFTPDLHHVQPSVTTSGNKSTHDGMIILENDLYVSVDSIPNSAAENNKLSGLNQTEFAVETNPCVNNVYAVVDKKRKPDNKAENP
ncbi:uncharacterized protein LOC126830854 isoform X2 [Patella vulgata]|uniref:uncharacterized protein LOC126830854 isoform X2 n=1 Tax=Patella vulgata TaxID=6465 RepID=UPI0024A7CCFE|nr:uncharacterized protein LOC126830854 isoform X2 [Patella vulgata]